MDYRDLAGEHASTRSPASAWSSTSARARSTRTRAQLARLLRAGRPAAQPRHRAAAPRRPGGGPVLGALRVPRRRRRCTCRAIQRALERAGFVTDHVEGFGGDYAETLRHWARRLDETVRRGAAAGRAGARARLAALPARGAARASRAASSRSTRYGPGGPHSPMSDRQRWTLIAVCVATFMLLLDITVVNVALPGIRRDLARELHRPPVGRRRLLADARGVPADGRLARRPARAAARIRRRPRASSRCVLRCCGLADDAARS